MRSPLFSSLRRLFWIASASNDPKLPNASELLEISRTRKSISRREFLKRTGQAVALAAAGNLFPYRYSFAKDAPKIAIVGAGIAGLSAAYELRRAGFTAQIYEGNTHYGGRIFTARDILAPGLVTELGGEFIDSSHDAIRSLAKELHIGLADRSKAFLLKRRGYFFGGMIRPEKEVIEALSPFIEQLRQNGQNWKHFDNLSLAEYFERLKISGWIKDLMEVAAVTEFGLDAAEQSAANFIQMISSALPPDFNLLGTSDERFVVVGGNDRITEGLAMHSRAEIFFSHRLESIRSKGKGFTMSFNTGTSIKDITADIVLLAIPFSVLRDVEMKVELPDWKRKAIKELGYGTNTKVMTGFSSRIWQESGYDGEIFSDEPFQLSWDNALTQNNYAGGLTAFTGGSHGIEAGKESPDIQGKRFLTSLEKIFPGISKAHNGKSERFYWTGNPFTKGSYSCYKPGQVTSILYAEGEPKSDLFFSPSGNLFFAGEHTSLSFQGFMNGAAQTGKEAAGRIIKLLK